MWDRGNCSILYSIRKFTQKLNSVAPPGYTGQQPQDVTKVANRNWCTYLYPRDTQGQLTIHIELLVPPVELVGMVVATAA